MNLLFYVPQMAAYGGIERHVCNLAGAVARCGHHVRFLTTSNSLGHELRQELAHPMIEFRELPRSRGSAGLGAKLGWLLAELFRSRNRRWDIIYTNGQSALSGLVWRAGRGSARIIHHHHNAADAGEQFIWSPAFRRVLRQAPELIACSRATRDALNAATSRRDSHFMPYLTCSPVERGQIAQRAPGSPLRFGFCGRLIPEKGIDVILALAGDARLDDIEWHIHGAGEAYPPQRFAGLPRIVYHGAYESADEHARALLALDAAVLFSTHNEGMPLSLIEAMSAGLPWIATDRGGTRELATELANSLVAPATAGLSELGAAVRELADRIAGGRTSRVVQRTVYDRYFAPEVAAAEWLAYFGSSPRAGSS